MGRCDGARPAAARRPVGRREAGGVRSGSSIWSGILSSTTAGSSGVGSRALQLGR
ncbi:hypothetical protein AB0K60_17445 [Thermopolyspora sp. NPDC052614]|uniref:hypothetical protein n=1 Tax=Thermopolyspora sp. NPDC052614 TaxID=3155682 RepID=UPI003444CA31